MGIRFIETIVGRSANKGPYAVTVTPSEFIGLQNKTTEEKRINLALDLRVKGAKGATKIRS